MREKIFWMSDKKKWNSQESEANVFFGQPNSDLENTVLKDMEGTLSCVGWRRSV